MNSEFKCPFCKQELEYLSEDRYGNMYCNNYYVENDKRYAGSKELWQELIHTRKALNFAISTLTVIGEGCVVEHSVVGHEDDNKIKLAKIALDKIKTALEQKE